MAYKSDGQERLFTGHTGRIFLLLTFAFICIKLLQRLLPPLLPAIINDFAITAFQAGIALTLLRVTRASMEYPGGRFADQLSRTTVLLTALGFATIGAALLSSAVTYVLLLIGITIFGMGFGLFDPSSRALMSDIFVQKRGRAFGIHMAGSGLSGVVASGIAIVIITFSTWRAAFLPLAFVLFITLGLFYYVSREPILFESVEFAFRDTGFRLIGDKTLRWILIVYSLFIMATSGVMGFLPTFLIEVHNFSFALASSAFALVYAAGFFAKPVSGFLSDRFSRTPVAGSTLIIACSGLALLVAVPVKEVVLGGIIVYAVGQQGMPPALEALLMDRFPDESMGGDVGAMRTIFMMVGSLGPGYTGFVVSTFGFVPAYLSLLLLFLTGGLILSWFSAFGWPSAQEKEVN